MERIMLLKSNEVKQRKSKTKQRKNKNGGGET